MDKEELENDEVEQAKGWLSALNINSEFEASLKEIILLHIEELEFQNRALKIELRSKEESAYWKGYIKKQQEAMEICKICKYREQYFEMKVEGK